MADGIIDYLSDNVTDFRGPVDITADPIAALGTILSDGVTAVARLFNVANDTKIIDLETKLSEDEPAAATAIAVDNITGFADGDSVHVELDSGLIHATTINGVPAAGVITLTAGIDTAASATNVLRRVTLNTNATYLSVAKIGEWEIGDTLILIHDDLDRQSATVTQVLTSPCPLIVIDAVVAKATSARMEVKNQLGADLTMADFGTFPPSDPTPGDKEWGYRATIPHTHAGLRPKMYVRSEMTAVDGTINAFQTFKATVKRAT